MSASTKEATSAEHAGSVDAHGHDVGSSSEGSGQQEAAQAAASLLLQRELTAGGATTGGGDHAGQPTEPTYEVPDFAARDQRLAAQAADVARIQPKYGASPRRYRGFLEVPTAKNEQRFAAAVPGITKAVNAKLAASGSVVRVTEAEFATNFLAEGGILLIKGQDSGADNVSGFRYAGIDTIVDRYNSLKHLLPADLCEMIESGRNITTETNERKQQVHSLDNLTLEQAMAGNAAMFASSRTILVKDLAAQGTKWTSLTPREQFYWTTVYYNCGEGMGRTLLAKHGVHHANDPWTQADDHTKFGGNPHFNASWRTATWELVSGGSTKIETGIKPVPMRKLTASAIVAEVGTAYQTSVIPVATGGAPVKGLSRMDEVLSTATQALGADEKSQSQLARFSNSFAGFKFVLDNMTALDSPQYKAVIAPLFAANKRPVPKWSELGLTQIAALLDEMTQAAASQSPALSQAKDALTSFRPSLDPALKVSRVLAMPEAERGSAVQKLYTERIAPVLESKAPIPDDIEAIGLQLRTYISQPNATLGQSERPADLADRLAQVQWCVSDFTVRLGADGAAVQAKAGLPPVAVKLLTLAQLKILCAALTGPPDAVESAHKLHDCLAELDAFLATPVAAQN